MAKAKIEIGLDDDTKEVLRGVTEALVAAMEAVGGDAKEAKPDKKGRKAKGGPTVEDVRTKLKEYAALEGKSAAIQILNDAGAASVGELDEGKFQDVIDKCDE